MKRVVEKNNLSHIAGEVLELMKDTNINLCFLKGDLGAGKTTFAREIAKKLGIKEGITSPTFNIMKTYKIPKGYRKNFIHIDAYRLGEGDDLGFDIKDMLDDKSNMIFVEWPDYISGLKDIDRIEVEILHTDDLEKRIFRILNK